MAELMAKTNRPIPSLLSAYEGWADGGWGSILTGAYLAHCAPRLPAKIMFN